MKKLPRFVPLLFLAVTLVAFVYYLHKKPGLLHSLASTNPWLLLLLLGLYGVFLLCLVWVYDVTLKLCGKQLKPGENLLLTCYSTITNFFGPLQSGPGVRAVYLKQKHQVKLRDYTVATLLYYALYAVISALFLLSGSGKYWPLGIVGVVAVAGGSALIIRLARQRLARRSQGVSDLTITPALVGKMAAATFCQLTVQAIIFFIELRMVHTGASLRQAFTYGGAANFALFVSLTPGAIGFREAFLGFSQRLHHIAAASIVAANVIDRAVYITYLGGLFLIILALHARKRFVPKPTTKSGN